MQPRSDVWATFAPDREVLAVARSVPAAGRLLDVSALLSDDRIGVTFTAMPGSRSAAGVVPLLRAAGVERIIPWDEAVATAADYHLALAASTKGGLHELSTPLVLMPHGAGHNRRVGSAPGSLSHASGLDPSELLRDGRPFPERIVLSHQEQADRLKQSCPPAAERGAVVGDPAFDRMLAALGRRERYREALRVRNRRLVVVTSTWNRGSLLGAQRELVRELLAELPEDEYRVSLVAHPNVWYERGRGQLELWFADEIEAGLALIPPFEGWRAALIAADLVVGDTGSVTSYAAALGRPVLLAAFDTADIDPGSPLIGFGAALPRIAPGGVLEQVEHAARGPAAPAADTLIDHPGGSAARLRSLLYSLLELPEPGAAARYLPLPDVPEAPDDPTAWRIAGEVPAVPPGGPARLRVRRFPAGAPSAAADRLLVVDAEDAIIPRWDSADAWSHRRGRTEAEALAWMRDRLTAHPKAVLATASVGEHCALLLHRCGQAMRVYGESAPLDAAVLAAAAAWWARDRRPWRAWRERLLLEVGEQTLRLRADPPPLDFRFLGDDEAAGGAGPGM
ncbi:hypothetical protein GCM10027570_28650 [Streptomonospora sediminis]